MAAPSTQWVNSLFSAGDGKARGWMSGGWFGKTDKAGETSNESSKSGLAGKGSDKLLQQQQQQQRRPRFAVELDGLNCFETIVPQ